MARTPPDQRPLKRQRVSGSDEESASESPKALLARLNAQCAAFFGSDGSSFSRDQAATAVEEDFDSEEGQDDDFEGFSDQESVSDLDDDQDLLLDGEDSAPVLVFDDPSRSSGNTLVDADVKSFMVRPVRLLSLGNTQARIAQSARVGRRLEEAAVKARPKTRKEKKEQEEEQHLKALDGSLATLLQDFDPSTMGSSIFSHTRKATAPVQRNAPLPIRKGIERTRVKRAKRDAEADRISGAVRARGGRESDQGPALTKATMRKQSGAEDKRRRQARGLGGVVGRMGPGGALLRLSADEIRRGNDGKEAHQLMRARKRGGFEGNRRLMVKEHRPRR